MPPVMGQHEAVAVVPFTRQLVHPLHAFLMPTLCQHDMGNGVMGPGLLALHIGGAAAIFLRKRQQARLLPPEGAHAIGVGAAFVMADHRIGNPQQGRIIADIEKGVLRQLRGKQIARKFLHMAAQRRQKTIQLSIMQVTDDGDKLPLPLCRLCGAGPHPRVISGGNPPPFRIFKEDA